MTPRADEFGGENLSTTDEEDDDEALKRDLAALSKACTNSPRNSNGVTAVVDSERSNDDGNDGNSDDDDVDYLLKLDPLLAAGDSIVPAVNHSGNGIDDSDEEKDAESIRKVNDLFHKLESVPPPPPPPASLSDDDDDDVDDVGTARAILSHYSNKGSHVGEIEILAQGDQISGPVCEGDVANGSDHYKTDAASDPPETGTILPTLCAHSGPHELCCVSEDPEAIDVLTENIGMQHFDFDESCELDACESFKLPLKRSNFPPSAQAFIDAIKKNRSLQRFIRSKLIEIEAKIEENKQIRNKVKILKDFQVSCTRRTGNMLSLKKDPRVQLISAKKASTSKNSKSNRKVSAMCYGPDENSCISNYKNVLERFPLSLDRKRWSNVERESLLKGIKQQFQQKMLQISVDRACSEHSFGDENAMDSICAYVKDIEITPDKIREFLPNVNWDQLASMYVADRTGAECESRWLNCEDPLINQGAWASEEDRSLLLIVQHVGIRNWFDIALSLATSRTPFQCLARYQRSLNPAMLNSEWTEEEDAQLCSAVAFYGERDWQSVASVLERRTGPQCSNRWKKSLFPEKKGSFTHEEDVRLTVAFMLFERRWNQIAKFVPGRIQSQCRDRYLNSLDPSLKWSEWTEEEDLRLEAAIHKHGFCWSKVAEEVPPRTDSQCRKRWKVVCPDQVPLLQEARRKQKSILANNFVDRESERPALTLNDFLPLCMLAPKSDGALNHRKKRKRNSRKSKRSVKKTQPDTEQEDHIEVYSDKEVNACEDVRVIASRNCPRKRRSKRHAKRARVQFSDELKTCSESSEDPDLDMTLACFLHNKSNKRPSRTRAVSNQIENQIPSGEQDGLSHSCGTTIDETKDLFMQQNVDSDRLMKDENDDDVTIACIMGNIPKKTSKVAKGRRNTSSTKLKNPSALLCKGHSGSKPTIISDDSGVSKNVEEETALHGGVAEPTYIDVEEKDNDLPSSFPQNRPKRQRKRPSRYS